MVMDEGENDICWQLFMDLNNFNIILTGSGCAVLGSTALSLGPRRKP